MSDTDGEASAPARMPEGMEGALVRVLGTAELCRSWFDEHHMAFTAADLVALTRLVLEQQETAEMEASLDPDGG